MMIFLRNLPPAAGRRELAEMMRQAIKKSWILRLIEKPVLHRIQLLKLTDPDTGSVERHGLIRLTPDRFAQGMLRRLDGSSLRGRPIEARPFEPRVRRDRRRGFTDPGLLGFRDRRHGDRRRQRLRVECYGS